MKYICERIVAGDLKKGCDECRHSEIHEKIDSCDRVYCECWAEQATCVSVKDLAQHSRATEKDILETFGNNIINEA